MKLENQVVSLELAKKLKELGVKQESYLYWQQLIFPTQEWILIGNREDSDYNFPAFTVAELGEMLPKRLVGDHPLWYLTIHCNDNYYNVSYETFNGKIEKDFEARDKNEANARAKMLIHLIENKLITL